MAAGTTVSRLSGFVRSTLLAAALGTQLHADVFTIANTVPNMLYILLAGGVFNAVLVPQLVRAMKQDPDGGDAYTNRIITLAALFLAGTTALLVLAAPWVMRLYLDDAYFTADFTEQRESVIAFARLCLPQVFFYGMFVLVGQVLNSRDRFGPMMWAPIANNVDRRAGAGDLPASSSARRAVTSSWAATPAARSCSWGSGSTLGIAVQLLILLPYLRAAGFRYRPRFDFRGTGLGHTFRLGRLDAGLRAGQPDRLHRRRPPGLGRYGGLARARVAARTPTPPATPSTPGRSCWSMVPHAIATVSLATAVLPRLSRLATDADLRGLAGQIAATTRTALALILPFALLLPAIALPLSDIVFGYGAASRDLRGLLHHAGRLRPGPGLLHRALPDAARLLRPGAQPHGLLRAVRHRHRERRARRGRRQRRRRPSHRARPRRGLRRRLRPRCGHLLPRPAAGAGLDGDPRAGPLRGAHGDRGRPGRRGGVRLADRGRTPSGTGSATGASCSRCSCSAAPGWSTSSCWCSSPGRCGSPRSGR